MSSPKSGGSRGWTGLDSNGNEEAAVSMPSQNYHHPRQVGQAVQSDLSERVVVAVDATKEITKHALEWALTNVVVQAGETIILLAMLPIGNYVRKNWGIPALLPMLAGECRYRSGTGAGPGTQIDLEEDILESCSIMMRQLHKLSDAKKVNIQVRVTQASARETTAEEAKKLCATWVVLDRHLKKEAKYCMELLECNIVLVKPSEPKILRLNLKRTGPSGRASEEPDIESSSMLFEGLSFSVFPKGFNQNAPHGPASSPSRVGGYPGSERTTPSSSPDDDIGPAFTPSDPGTSSNSSSEPSNSPYPNTHSNQRSSEVGVRGAILEAVAAELIEKGGSYAIFDSDSDDTSPMPGVSPDPASGASSGNSTRGKSFFKASEKSRLEKEKPTSGKRIVGYAGDMTPSSRSGSRSSSRRGSPVTPAQKESPVQLASASGRQSLEGQPSLNRREPSVGQTLRAVLQANAELDRMPAQRGTLSELLKPERDVRQVSEAKDSRQRYGGEPWGEMLPPRSKQDLERASSVRKAMMLSRHMPLGAPPLCSICQHKAPVFGKPPRRYSFTELELATGGFCQTNFLAEGGYGSVYRGVMPDGQAVAVKQHKLASTQGDKEFCAEVEVLSCAQHRNVVMLNGYCVEGKRRLLVYEFICNGSLDSHLYGRDRPPLEWHSRQKIAVGAARGLRYLHEECRVGCIVHRDLRPNNILLTHDFEPMVGDFGLARWQPDGDCGVETRVIGTFGYLAPEYAQSGQITEKADVYSFGVVLLELITGRKAVDIDRPKGQQCLTEWARPLLEEKGSLLVDPRLENRYADFEVHCMLHAAACCIRRDPQQRPRMSQVLRMLAEGEMIMDASGSPTPIFAAGRPSCECPGGGMENCGTENGKIMTDIIKSPNEHQRNYLTVSGKKVNLSHSAPLRLSPTSLSYSGKLVPERPVAHSGKLSFEALKATYEEKGSYRHVSALAYESYTAGKSY